MGRTEASRKVYDEKRTDVESNASSSILKEESASEVLKQAIGEAFKAIQCGEIDLAIAGGVQEYSLWKALNLEKYN